MAFGFKRGHTLTKSQRDDDRYHGIGFLALTGGVVFFLAWDTEQIWEETTTEKWMGSEQAIRFSKGIRQ